MKFSTQDQRSAPSRLRNAICDHCKTATVHIDDGTESFGRTVLQCVPCKKAENELDDAFNLWCTGNNITLTGDFDHHCIETVDQFLAWRERMEREIEDELNHPLWREDTGIYAT